MSRAGRSETSTQDANFQKGNNHLLVIGINQYQDSNIPNLRNARKDAEAVAELLQAHYGFEQCTTLYDEEAKGREIIRAFGKLKQQVKNEDNLLIYIAGHGHYEDGVGYMIPYDGEMEEPAYSFLRHSTIKEDLGRIKAQHIFLVADTCFSGALFSGTRNVLPEIKDIRQFCKNVAPFPSRIILTAGRIEEVSDGRYNDNSPFAKSFLTFLQNNSYEIFPVSSLIQHIRETVPNNARQQPDWGRLLDANDQKGEMIFIRMSSEALDWKKIADSQNINDFMAFLRKHGYQSRYAEDALARIKVLEDRHTWEQVNKHSISALLQFIRANRESTFVADAEKRIAELESGFSSKPEPPVERKESKPLPTKSAADYFNEGYDKAEKKDYRGAVEAYTKAIELNPKYANAYVNRGVAKKNLQDYTGAIADYTKAIELTPQDTDAYNNRGLAKYNLKDYTGAIADFTKILEINPKYANAYTNRGAAYQELGKLDLACPDWRRAIELGENTVAPNNFKKHCQGK